VRDRADEWPDARLHFDPEFAYTLTEAADGGRAAAQVALFFRGMLNDEAQNHPLKVDARTLAVTVVEERLQMNSQLYHVHRGSLYWARFDPRTHQGEDPIQKIYVWRWGWPDFKLQRLGDAPRLARASSCDMAFVGERVFLLGDSGLHVADSVLNEFRPVRLPVAPDASPQGKELVRSNHYGLILSAKKRAYAMRVREK
jgi:hypothetical protein